MENEILDQPKLHRKAYPNLRQSFGILGLCIAVQIGVSILFAPAMMRFSEDALMGPLIFLLTYILIFGFILWYTQRERERINGHTAFSYVAIPMIAYPIIFLLTIAAGILIEPLMELLPMPDQLWDVLVDFIKRKDVFTFLAVVIAAPIFEELIFRGVILDGLLKNTSPAKAIFWSAFIFGVVHLNPWQFVAAFILGLVIGWLYYKSKSLLPCIFVHFVANGNSFITRFFIDLDDPEALNNSTRAMIGDGNYMLLIAVSLIITIASIFLLNSILTKERNTMV